MAVRQTASQKRRVSKSAWSDFKRGRAGHATALRARPGEDIHHAVERQILTRYPGVFTIDEINARGNMRGIPVEKRGKKALHGRAIRDKWDYHYRQLDALIVQKGLKPGTARYNRFVRQYLASARDEIDWALGSFFTEQRRK